MNRDALEARKKDLLTGVNFLRAQIADGEDDLQKKRTNLTATLGALQECQHWIDQLPAAE